MSRLICSECLTYDIWADSIQFDDVIIIPPESLYCEPCNAYTTHIVTNRMDS